MNLADKKILITGANGFLGSHLVEHLMRKRGVSKDNLLLPTSSNLDLTKKINCQEAVRGRHVVIHLAAKVGGIGFNQEKSGEIFYDNLMMGTQLMEEARLANVEKFVTVGTICSYPKITPVPFKEENLWDGETDEVTGAYGQAKKMLLVQSIAYLKQYGFNAIYLLPTNLYGPRDHFNLEYSHVIPALIKKMIEAEKKQLSSVEVWGTGKATREFLYVGDAAEGILSATEKYNETSPVNLGTGIETPIAELASLIAEICHYKGNIIWNTSKPDGQPRRCLDISKAREGFGFGPTTSLRKGLEITIDWYLKNKEQTK